MERAIVVTGAGRGIGRVIASTLAERGDFPIVIDKNMEQAKETEDLIRKRGFAATSYCADLTRPDDVANAFQSIFEKYERIDALINNAGYYAVRPIEELTIDFWNVVIDANLKTAFLCSLEAFKYMRIAKYGKIVNMSSTTAISSSASLCPYIAAKAGIIGLTRALAMDLGPYNITVNAIAAGLTATEYAYEAFGKERFDRVRALKAIKRDQVPDDLIGAIFFLIDSASDFMTGQTLSVDGGRAFI